MMSKWIKVFGLCGVMIAGIFSATLPLAMAQSPLSESCGEAVRLAMQAADNACVGTGRNQVCYGNVSGAVTMRDTSLASTWLNVGDSAGLTSISALTLSPMDEVTDQWGVAVMQVQANLPDTLPGQNVTMLLFGDVTLEDAVTDQARVGGQTLTSINIRFSPDRNAALMGIVPTGMTVIITGKTVNAAGETWLRVKYEDYRTRTGWVPSDLIQVDLAALPEVAPDSLVYNTMQAFYFKTGMGVTQCNEFPTDGVIIQTPKGAGLVNMTINGVGVTLGSTAFLTLDASETGSKLGITLLEGRGLIESMGDQRVLIPGSQTTVALDAQGSPVSPPSEAQSYTPESFEAYREQFLRLGVELPAPAGQFDDDWDDAEYGDFGDPYVVEVNPDGAVWRDNKRCDNPPPNGRMPTDGTVVVM